MNNLQILEPYVRPALDAFIINVYTKRFPSDLANFANSMAPRGLKIDFLNNHNTPLDPVSEARADVLEDALENMYNTGIVITSQSPVGFADLQKEFLSSPIETERRFIAQQRALMGLENVPYTQATQLLAGYNQLVRGIRHLLTNLGKDNGKREYSVAISSLNASKTGIEYFSDQPLIEEVDVLDLIQNEKLPIFNAAKNVGRDFINHSF